MSMVIKESSVDNLIADPSFADLLNNYANELAVKGLPHPKAKIEMYRQLEILGKIHPIAAYFDNILIGFVNVLMSENPHYGICIAVTESFFVLKKYRKTGAGIMLRREAELKAKSLSSPGIFISAPSGGNLAMFLEGSKDYKETGRTFFKEFANA